MFDEAGAIGIIAEELDSHAKSHVQVARAAMSVYACRFNRSTQHAPQQSCSAIQ